MISQVCAVTFFPCAEEIKNSGHPLKLKLVIFSITRNKLNRNANTLIDSYRNCKQTFNSTFKT